MSAEEFRFGTDGVRGKAGEGPLLPAHVTSLGAALADFMEERAFPGPVVLGGDTRGSREEIGEALCRGLTARGVRCLDVGVLPTAGIALVGNQLGAALTAVISASHNPAQDNGIKIFTKGEEKLGDQDARWIEARWARDDAEGIPTSKAVIEPIGDGADRYLTALKATVGSVDLSGRKLALDMAHGAAYQVGPRLFQELGAEVVVRGHQPDGNNINDDCGSLHPEGVSALVQESGADFGLAVDGDADRVVLVDERGQLVDGDGVLAAVALDLMERGELPGNCVVGTIMSNFGLELFLRDRGGNLERTPVGDRFVSARMREGGFCLGGEPSGHVIFGASLGYLGDGLYTALRVAELLVRRRKALSEFAELMQPVPQVLKAVRVSQRPPLEEISGFREKLADAEKELGGSGRVVVRYSGTEPVLRVMVEGLDARRVESLAADLADHVESQLGVTSPS